jgi:type IV fimbrial biogenesis protein FimT
MRAVTGLAAPRRRRAQAGFTLMEAMIVLAIIGTMLAIGVPNMTSWLRTSRAMAATEFYAEGFKLARAEALKHNSASRIALTENSANGQLDWQVDLCFPTASVPCSSESGAWSTPTASAAGDPEGAGGFRSVFRTAAGLPDSSVLAQSLSPSGATDVYFTSLGWVDTVFSPRLRRIDLAPAAAHAGTFPSAAVVITLAGLATKCDPTVAASDSRACPP